MSVDQQPSDPTGVLRWEDPPPFTTTQRGDVKRPWAIVAAELKANPGDWGVVYEGNPTPKLAVRIEQGLSPWFRPAGAYEATQRSRRGQVTIYARYIGAEAAGRD